MIPVRRGEEPAELRSERFWRLARAMVQHHEGKSPAEDQLTGYECAREALMSAQGYKCAYCEMRLREGSPVEHFRPKSVYFWLTWSWNNLFVACSTCNDPARKGSRFELFDPSVRLQAGQPPPGNEQPKLLDPGDPAVSPVRSIEFRVISGKWRPIARGGDQRGEEAIRTFGLDRGPILDHYADHIDLLRSRIDDVHAALRAGNPVSVSERWRALTGNAFSMRQQFQGLAYDVLAAEFPASIRTKWGLVLREPGDGLPPDPPVRERKVVAHEGLPEHLALRVRALGKRPDAAKRDEVIEALCAHQPRTCAELADILERDENYTYSILRTLVSTGRLYFTSPHYQAQPVHP